MSTILLSQILVTIAVTIFTITFLSVFVTGHRPSSISTSMAIKDWPSKVMPYVMAITLGLAVYSYALLSRTCWIAVFGGFGSFLLMGCIIFRYMPEYSMKWDSWNKRITRPHMVTCISGAVLSGVAIFGMDPSGIDSVGFGISLAIAIVLGVITRGMDYDTNKETSNVILCIELYIIYATLIKILTL